eukprot:11703264-Prorocentrum_lima.AAC.1
MGMLQEKGKSPILIGCAYLVVGTGMGTSNMGIIGSALATAQKLGLHCCIGGDFNLSLIHI